MPRPMPPVRTSSSHPLPIAEVMAGDAGGRIGITFCPGKCGPSLYDYRWQRDLAADLDVIARWGARAIVTLIEAHEFELLQVPDLGAQVVARGMAWHHLPIPDVQAPDERFATGWQRSGPALLDWLIDGQRVLVHCRGGLGRAGTVAAQLLVELGVTPQDAIQRVRAARPGAIETDEQERYVLTLARPLRDRDEEV